MMYFARYMYNCYWLSFDGKVLVNACTKHLINGNYISGDTRHIIIQVLQSMTNDLSWSSGKRKLHY